MKDLNLKHRRDRLGMTQTELADLLGVNQSTIDRWEDGKGPAGFAVPYIDAALKKIEQSRRPAAE
jgi:DNA-binding XRE family transcriptional regulator